ncbi:S41 family peptidase [Flavitalea flava]
MKNFLLFFFCLFQLFCISCRTTKTPFDAGKKFTAGQLKEDYSLFRHILEDLHPSLYWYTPRDSMDVFFERGYSALTDSMTEPQFKTLLSYVISRVGCGHTAVRYSKDYSRYLDTARLQQFPLILKCWQDTMVVAANLNRRDSILKRGVVINSINGRTASQLRDSLFRFFVTDGYNLTGKYQYLSTGLNFSNWYRNVFGYPAQFTIDYLDSNNTLKESVIPVYNPLADTVKRLFRRQAPGPETEPGGKGRKKREEFYTRNLVIDSATNTAFMSLNTFEHGNHLVRFFRESFRTLDEKQVANLVIDVRSNGGGDASNSTLLTRYIIDKKFKIADSLYAIRRHSGYDRYIEKSFLYRLLMIVLTSKRSDGRYHYGYFERHYYNPVRTHHFNGQVYILTGGNSFSATSLFAGALKGQKNVTLVGEETGGGYYGNTAWMIPDVELPNTHIRFRLPRFRLVVNKTREKDGRGVLPDVPALPTVEAIRKGLDFKTAKAKELIQKERVQKEAIQKEAGELERQGKNK